MNIELGKEYRTRSHQRAKVYGLSPCGQFWAGWVHGQGGPTRWLPNGRFNATSQCENSLDLIALWDDFYSASVPIVFSPDGRVVIDLTGFHVNCDKVEVKNAVGRGVTESFRLHRSSLHAEHF